MSATLSHIAPDPQPARPARPAPLVYYPLANGQVLPGLHADDVADAASVLATYVQTWPLEDAVARCIATYLAAVERRAISEKAAARRREIAERLR